MSFITCFNRLIHALAKNNEDGFHSTSSPAVYTIKESAPSLETYFKHIFNRNPSQSTSALAQYYKHSTQPLCKGDVSLDNQVQMEAFKALYHIKTEKRWLDQGLALEGLFKLLSSPPLDNDSGLGLLVDAASRVLGRKFIVKEYPWMNSVMHLLFLLADFNTKIDLKSLDLSCALVHAVKDKWMSQLDSSRLDIRFSDSDLLKHRLAEKYAFTMTYPDSVFESLPYHDEPINLDQQQQQVYLSAGNLFSALLHPSVLSEHIEDISLDLPQLPQTPADFATTFFMEKRLAPQEDNKSETTESSRCDSGYDSISVQLEDVWLQAASLDRLNALNSWENLGKASSLFLKPVTHCYVTECGSEIFDAVYQNQYPRVFNADDDHVYKQDVLISALLKAAMGTESCFFIWKSAPMEAKDDFGSLVGHFTVHPRFSNNLRIVGCTKTGFQGIMTRFLQLGTHMKRVQHVIEDVRKNASYYGTLGLHFAECLAYYLRFIQGVLVDLESTTKNNTSFILDMYHTLEPCAFYMAALAEFCSCRIPDHQNPILYSIKSKYLDSGYLALGTQRGYWLPPKSRLLGYLWDYTVSLEFSLVDSSKQHRLMYELFMCITKTLGLVYGKWLNSWLGNVYGGEWMQDRTLDLSMMDAFQEFFVSFVGQDGGLLFDGDTYWTEGWQMNRASPIPGFLGEKTGFDVLHAGKELRLLQDFSPDHFLLRLTHHYNLDITQLFQMPSDEICERLEERLTLLEQLVYDFYSFEKGNLVERKQQLWETAMDRKQQTIQKLADQVAQKKQQQEAKKKEWNDTIQAFLEDKAAYEQQVEQQQKAHQESLLAQERIENQVNQQSEQAQKEQLLKEHELKMRQLEKQEAILEWRRKRLALNTQRKQVLDQWERESIDSISDSSSDVFHDAQDSLSEISQADIEQVVETSGTLAVQPMDAPIESENALTSHVSQPLDEQEPSMLTADDADIKSAYSVKDDKGDEPSLGQEESFEQEYQQAASEKSPEKVQESGQETCVVECTSLWSFDSSLLEPSQLVLKNHLGTTSGEFVHHLESAMSSVTPFSDIHASIIPKLSAKLESIIMRKSYLIHQATLRVFLFDLGLTQQLKIMRNFYLLGDGNMIKLLKYGIFESALQDDFGTTGSIQLNGRTTWPASASEWSTSLRRVKEGAISDSCLWNEFMDNDFQDEGLSRQKGKGWMDKTELSDRLHFGHSVDEEVGDDPNDIHVLDFLKLDYAPPKSMQMILCPTVLGKYQTIFSYLLKLIRVEEAVNRLKMVDRRPKIPGPDDALIRVFSMEAKHFISGLLRYTFDVGISASWLRFIRSIRQALSSENQESSIRDIESLGASHHETLDRMHWRLFLRPNQKKLLKVVLDMLQSILTLSRYVCGASIKEEVSLPLLYKRFQAAKAILVKVLQDKGALVEDQPDTIEKSQHKRGSLGSSRITHWGSLVSERMCFVSLLSEIEY